MAIPDGFDWEAEGRRLGERLDALHAIAILGQDPAATALVALGIARAQAPKRRVALGDLLGDAEPLQGLVAQDDPHGLVDSFLYGISLNKVALAVPGDGELFLMPTGTEPPHYEEILANPRWRRLAAGFKEVGALLIIAAPADAPGVAGFVDMMDGAVLVGEAVPKALPLVQVISYVREPRVRPGTAAAVAVKKQQRRAKSGRIAAIAGIVLAIVLVAIGAWLAYRPLAGGASRPAWMTRRETAVAKTPVALSPSETLPPSAASDSASETAALPLPVNPADSDSAATFSVALTNANTPDGAIFYLQQNARNLPATTYAPISLQGVRWYRVLAGAYLQSTSADSLLAALHARGLLDGRSGSVVRTPFAFLIDSGVAAGAVQAEIARYATRRVAVYPLFQPDGSARLYTGAFETPAQAAMFAESLRAAGVTPVLAYRIGRVS